MIMGMKGFNMWGLLNLKRESKGGPDKGVPNYE